MSVCDLHHRSHAGSWLDLKTTDHRVRMWRYLTNRITQNLNPNAALKGKTEEILRVVTK